MAELSAKAERIADLYANGFKVAQIAADLSCSVVTVYKYLSQPLVKARLTEARAATLRPLVQLVESELRANVERLTAVRDDADENTRNRLAAVQQLNDFFLKIHERVEILPRLAALEASLADAAGGGDAAGDPSTD